MSNFYLEPDGTGDYFVHAESAFESREVTFLLSLEDVEASSAGRLTDTAQTARATIAFLLARQDASELPQQLYFADLIPAYPGLIDELVAILD